MGITSDQVKEFTLPSAIALLALSLMAHVGVYAFEVMRTPAPTAADIDELADKVAARLKPQFDQQLSAINVNSYLLSQSRIYRWEVIAKDAERQDALADAFRELGLSYPFKWPHHPQQPPDPPTVPNTLLTPKP